MWEIAMNHFQSRPFALLVVWLVIGMSELTAAVETDLERLQVDRGIIAVVGLPADGADAVVKWTSGNQALTVYFQSENPTDVAAMRQAAKAAGTLGVRVFVDQGKLDDIHLSNNVADGAVVFPPASMADDELLRVLRPRAIAWNGERELVKAVPAGIDEWTHPYHGPDNNPQSTDQLVKGDFRTQFLAIPKFSPMPEQTVVAGGRIFKAMGHIAHKANQNEWLNTLLCINAYNGTILWRRPLPAGFMIHRNTMVGTDNTLLMGDAQSCKVFDAATGEIRHEITVPDSITDGPVWKWMALRDGVLYALVGNPEIQVDTQRSARRGLGHWPWGMWKGHDYKDPRTSFGFGRTLVAVDVETKKLLWHYRDEEFLDARGVCMKDGRIYCFSPERFLLCLDAHSGDPVWKNSDESLLAAVGPNSRAQHYVTGYATTCYLKCDEDHVFFAGPQRDKMVVASTQDGALQWTYPHGNLQLVLRKDAIYAAGPKTTGVRLDYDSGQQLSTLPTRRACTRATGCADSIFYRTSGGTVRVMTEASTAEHIAPMRPPCQDGVIVSNGHLYWGPWMCGCQLSLYGHIALAPAAELASSRPPSAARSAVDIEPQVAPLNADAKRDWLSYRGSNARDDETTLEIPLSVEPAWTVDVSGTELPTAPVLAGGLIFVADRTGCVQALDPQGANVWTSYTSGAIYYAPAIAHDRLYVGSADGYVYAFEARTGRQLWKYRVAPNDQRIPVYGKLINRWPVAGGVVVQGNVVYAAAGIAHYDGTYLVALDAKSGRLRAQNTGSGALSKDVNSGISLQGNLSIVDNELRFLAGGVYETARFDLETLECLNKPKAQVTSQFRTAFYPFYPSYGKYVSLHHVLEDRSSLVQDASYEGSLFSELALQAPRPEGVPEEKKEAARWARRRGTAKPAIIWQDTQKRRFTSFIIADEVLLGGGHPDGKEEPFLLALNVADGSTHWHHPLPALPVKGGTALGQDGSIYVALENGQLACFTAKK